MPIMLAQLEIASPGRLLVLVLLPALVYLALRGRRDLSWWQRATATSLRCLIFGLLCLAWATPSCRVASDRQFIVVAVDESISAASDAAKAAETILAHRNNKRQDVVVRQIAFGSDSAQTNIAGAIHHAQSLCPPDRVGKVVVVTDGLETDGSLLQAAAGSDVPISVLPVDAFSAPEIAVEQIITPGSVVPHELVDVEVIVTANHDDSVTLSLLSEGVLLATEPLNVAKGITTWRREVEPPQAGAMVLQAIVAGGRDTLEENNAMQAVFVRSAPTKVMIVGEPEKIESLKDAITSSGFDVDVRQPSEAPRSANELAPTSLLVLAEVTASDLQTQQLIALNRYVREGGGLITIGGDTTFGAAAYELTALEKMLPVVATEQPVQQQKSLALVLVVDKSKSMEEENRLGLAKEAAKKVAEVLQDRDQVGVLAFGNQSEWISRLAPLDNKDEVLARIDKLTAEGLTNMYPAVQRAYLALSQADTDSRHCILLTDGVPTPGF